MDFKHAFSRIAPQPTTSMFVPLLVAVLAFTYHVLLTVLVNYIPDDLFAAGMTAYALVGAVLSALGFLGIALKRPHLISVFATFLLVDALVAVVSRLLVLWVIMNTVLTDVWQICMAAAPYGLDGFDPLEVDPTHDVVTSARWQREHATLGRKHCGWALNAIQLLMMGLVIGMTMLQATSAMGIRRYGRQVERPRQEGRAQKEGLTGKRRPERA